MQALLVVAYAAVAVAVWVVLWFVVLKRPSEPHGLARLQGLARLTAMSALWLPGAAVAVVYVGLVLAVPYRAKWNQTS